MAHRSTIISVFFLSCLFNVPSVHAGVIDPIPIFKNVPDDPPWGGSHSEKTTLFLCPQSKDFGNQPEKVIAETLLMEALGEGYEGMVAVGEVIHNRARLFGKDPEAVCLMPKQFSCWNDAAKAREFLERYKNYYFIAVMAWREAQKTALTGGATDYHADYVHPYWADAYRVAARIGAHIFYVRS